MASILVVDDELSMREFLKILLERDGHQVQTAQDSGRALDLFQQENIDLVLSDIKMPGLGGLTLLQKIKEIRNTTPVIMITAYASPEDAVLAMKEGAFDYITKPFKVDEIKSIINSALVNLPSRCPERDDDFFEGIIGRSQEMVKIFDLIQRIAPTQTNVLIYGESGTGKELVARAIHNRSKVKDNSFVPITCSAIPEQLLESELFGYVKGAFTGAIANKPGLFETANNGTVFLDEIGELSPLFQTKLLRVLQEREFNRVGGTEPIKVNVRIVAATNKNLEEEVMAGRFREDLFYRLAVVPIAIPPLRNRKGDVPLLVDHFLKKYSAGQGKTVREISTYALKVLMEYDFPGNVRELENIVERGVALENTNIILPESLTLSIHRKKKNREELAQGFEDFEDELQLYELGLDELMARIEKRFIEHALSKAEQSKVRAAELLKLSFRSLRYKVQKYGID